MKKHTTKIIALAFLMAIIGATIFMNKMSQYGPATSYNLSEIDHGVYLITYRVTSSIPAQNYDVAEYCINGTVCTIQGDVSISYTDGTPTMSISQNKLVRGTKATFYVPQDGVQREQGVGLR